MAISTEGKIGIALGLVALAGAGAIMIFPSQVWIGWSAIAIAAVGSILLADHHFKGDAPLKWIAGNRQRMSALAGMILSALLLVGFTAWHFWPQTRPPGGQNHPLDNNVSVRCDLSTRPTEFRPDKQIRIVAIAGPPKTEAEKNGVVANTSFIASTGPINWLDNPVRDAFKCTITNYSDKPLFDVEINLYIEWRDVIYVDGVKQSETVNSFVNFKTYAVDLGIGSSNEDYFYLMNYSDKFVMVAMPDSIDIREASETASTSVKLIQSKNFMDKTVLLQPAPVPKPPTPKEPPGPSSPEPALYIECSPVPRNVINTKNGRYRVFAISGGLASTPEIMGEMTLPSGETQDIIQLKGVAEVYQCTVTNYNPAVVFDVSITITINQYITVQENNAVNGMLIESGKDFYATFPKIDTGPTGSEIFYIINYTEKFISVEIPNSASFVLTPDGPKRKASVTSSLHGSASPKGTFTLSPNLSLPSAPQGLTKGLPEQSQPSQSQPRRPTKK